MQLKFLDTTLRDGEQTPGVSLTPDEKFRIALKLDELGIDIIEAGSPITSEGEMDAIKKITSENLSAEICGFARSIEKDIDAVLDCDLDSVHLVVPTSDLHLEYKLHKTQDEIVIQSNDAVQYALDHGLIIELSAEDATRTDISFLKKIFSEGISVGANRICACDTVGILTPERSFKFYSELKSLNAPLSVHCHNDFGLAVANSLSAIRAGVDEIHGTINGIGERAGNAALEEVIVALYSLYGQKVHIDLINLYDISRVVSRLTNINIQPNKAIVGDNAFAHESGIHSDGVIKNTNTYEPITPELVGSKRKFIMGKHIGIKGLSKRIDELGLSVSDEQLDIIFNKVKTLGDMGKSVSDIDLQAITDTVLGLSHDNFVDLEEVTIVSGNKITPTASVKLKIEDKDILEAGIGLGPVDAVILAIKKSLTDFADVELVEYHVDSITGGTDALIDVIVKLKYNNKVITARSTDSDIIMASVQAYISGVNRLLQK